MKCEATVTAKSGRCQNEQVPVTVIGSAIKFVNTNVKLDNFGRANYKFLNVLSTLNNTDQESE